MIIDSHTHTRYSKHATGSVDELVDAAMRRNVAVLTVTDHAPFYVDTNNRLLEAELDSYFQDIERARRRCAGSMKILTGLECDYMQGSEPYLQRLLNNTQLDFVIGSIHYVPVQGELVKVWDLSRLHDVAVLNGYFDALHGLLTCGLFDAVGHADVLLRGVPEAMLLDRLEAMVPLFADGRISYELNASGARKSVYDAYLHDERTGVTSYPMRAIIPALARAGATFTIGSDAHAPADVGEGVSALLHELAPLGVHTISYYEKRVRVDLPTVDMLVEPSPECGRDPA